MFNKGIDTVHCEPTARCNAACPMCARTNNEQLLANQGEWSFDDFKNYFPPHIVQAVRKWKWCGNFGDPIACKDLILMHEYILEHNPSASFIMSTNGGLRSEKFWSRLGEIYNNNNSVIEFHIDGLEDTNHIYRVGVKWEKLMRNVKAYIATGAKASWFYIPFFHNEEQIPEAEKMSEKLGFDKFVVKVSARFGSSNRGFFLNGAKLFPPLDPKYNFEKVQVEGGELVCFAEKRKEIYVDAWGRFWPCCWTGSEFAAEGINEINNLNHRFLEEIITDPEVDKWIQGLYADKHSVCNKRCTGKGQHMIMADGVQRPQKELWGKVSQVIATDRD